VKDVWTTKQYEAISEFIDELLKHVSFDTLLRLKRDLRSEWEASLKDRDKEFSHGLCVFLDDLADFVQWGDADG